MLRPVAVAPDPPVSNLKTHLLFAALLYAYGVVVWLCDLTFRFFTSRHAGTLGFDLFLVSACAACYWQGPHTNSAFDPYPFRATARFIGVLGMALTLGAKLLLEWFGRAV